MDKLAVSQKRDCWICYNRKNNTNLTIVNSEKILKICTSYLNPSVFIESFENETPVLCCNYCYESAVELLLLEKQVERLGKDISELSSLFLTRVLKQRDECGSKLSPESPSNSQGRTERCDLVNDLGFDAGDDENIIHSEDEIEVKYSYDETIPKVLSTCSKTAELSQPMSTTDTQDEDCHQQTIKTSMTDLLKCLKMPVIQLEKLQTYKGSKTKVVVDKTSSRVNLEINDPENCATFGMCNNYPSNENILPPEPTVVSKNAEKVVSTNSLSLSASVNAGEETVKCENDTDENKPYKCSVCGQGFFKLSDLEDHEKLHNNVHHYPCSIFDKSFLDPSRLKLHEKLHTAKRPFNSSCPKSVRTSSRNLIAHKKCGDTPFKCYVRSKSFRSSSNLKSDKRIHNGERSYRCTVCPKSFAAPRNLKNHRRVHTGERPYKCSFCPKSFLSSPGLKQHETLHTGDRPYKCSFCSKSFALVYLLKRHELIHTGERPFKCSSCESTFKLNQHLKSHREHKHGKTTEEFILP